MSYQPVVFSIAEAARNRIICRLARNRTSGPHPSGCNGIVPLPRLETQFHGLDADRDLGRLFRRKRQRLGDL